ncbi:flagellar biosynthesis protein FlhF [Pelobacter propionicus]|uniref:Flagellar biosynthesis protein FlhF n=1 Tax=Pelobacter propionicus (strain DSM 2379 / NBRC 103807 / OttBd1) TaxID=338966 RepID=A1AUL7_PELPD|nr:flagellar biosynthesis protein FlhF [Pelobacter propionicus]ABL01038.1 GTP-binding signal recognition particle SRP54, G- domain protein [Pelobacter propionicus DSM 2379]
MLVKTFQAPSMAEALRKVKAELGSDAMILSTKQEKTGGFLGFFRKNVYKVTAAVDPAHKAAPLAPPAMSAAFREQPQRQRTAKEDLENSMLAPLARELRELREKVEVLSRGKETTKNEEPAETVSQPDSLESGLNIQNIPRGDLEEIKKLLLNTLARNQEGDVKTVQWPAVPDGAGTEKPSGTDSSTNASPLAQELSRSGISSDLVETILDALDKLPSGGGNQALKSRLSEVFGRLIRFAGTLKVRKNAPRIIALVGPTGVGKTTTTAKLAAMHAFNRGNKVALITMDIFRVGAIEQLKTYSRIMGIPIEVASTPKELESAVEKHADCDLIFIDTAGRSHKDTEKLNEMKQFFADKIPMEVFLCLSATTKDRELTEILNCFSIFQISKVVFTKIDESESFGNMINVLMKGNLQVAYFTTGQRVPEDIEVATPSKLADMILRGATNE